MHNIGKIKNQLYFFATVIILSISCKKDNNQVTPETEEHKKEIVNSLISGSDCTHFERLFKGYKREEIMSVKQTSDGGYILCGSTETLAESESDILIIKTDCFGNTKWMKTITNTYSDYGYDITPVSSGGYFVTANFSINPSYWKMITHRGQFIFLDSAGTLVSKQSCTVMNSTILEKTIGTADGSFLTCGRDNNLGSFIVKTNERGNQYWIKYLGNASILNMTTHNNNFLICGSTRINNKQAIYVAEMNAAGDTLWTKSIDKNFEGSAGAITLLKNNEIAISGTYRTSNITFAGFVMRLDATGKEIWYKSLEAESVQTLVGISGTTDNNLVTVGTQPGGFYIAKLDSNTGSIIWKRRKSTDPIINDFELSGDGGLIIAGRLIQSQENADGYVLKTDADGN